MLFFFILFLLIFIISYYVLFNQIDIFHNFNARFLYSFFNFFFGVVHLWFSVVLLNNLLLNYNSMHVLLTSDFLFSVFFRTGSFWSNSAGSFFLFFWLIFFMGWIVINFFFVYFDLSVLIQLIKDILIVCIWFIFVLIFKYNIFFYFFVFSNENSFYTNPLLKDFFLVIHPVVLFFGMSGVLLYLVSFIKFRNFFFNRFWNFFYGFFYMFLNYTFKYMSFIFFYFMTFGIFLGGLWAYSELGWGGWWFWDSIEVISLIYWFFLIYILHVLYKELSLFKWLFFSYNFFIFFYFFLFLIVSFVFIRTGLLVSVHSFVGGGVLYLFFFFPLAWFLIYGSLCYFIKFNLQFVQVLSSVERFVVNRFQGVVNLFLWLFYWFCFVWINFLIFTVFLPFFLKQSVFFDVHFFSFLFIYFCSFFSVLLILRFIEHALTASVFEFSFLLSLIYFFLKFINFFFFPVFWLFYMFFVFLFIYLYYGFKYNNLNFFHFLFIFLINSFFVYLLLLNSYSFVANLGSVVAFLNFIVVLKNFYLVEYEGFVLLYCIFLVFLNRYFLFSIWTAKKYLLMLDMNRVKVGLLSLFSTDFYLVNYEGNFLKGWFFKLTLNGLITLVFFYMYYLFAVYFLYFVVIIFNPFKGYDSTMPYGGGINNYVYGHVDDTLESRCKPFLKLTVHVVGA